MDPDELMEHLTEINVYTTQVGVYSLTNEFLEEVEQSHNGIVGKESNVGQRLLHDLGIELPLGKEVGSEFDSRLIAYMTALNEFGVELGAKELLRTALVLQSLEENSDPIDGVPEAFLPIRGDMIRIFSSVSDCSIVYIWRDNCPPCEMIKKQLDDIFEKPPEDISLLAVYGPEYAVQLRENYDVTGGPTILFLDGERVDFRLLGTHSTERISSELAKTKRASSR